MTGCPLCCGPSLLHGTNGHDAACAARNMPVTPTTNQPDLDQLAELIAQQWTTT